MASKRQDHKLLTCQTVGEYNAAQDNVQQMCCSSNQPQIMFEPQNGHNSYKMHPQRKYFIDVGDPVFL